MATAALIKGPHLDIPSSSMVLLTSSSMVKVNDLIETVFQYRSLSAHYLQE